MFGPNSIDSHHLTNNWFFFFLAFHVFYNFCLNYGDCMFNKNRDCGIFFLKTSFRCAFCQTLHGNLVVLGLDICSHGFIQY